MRQRYINAGELYQLIVENLVHADLWSFAFGRVQILKADYFLGEWTDIEPIINWYAERRPPYSLQNFNCVEFATTLQGLMALQAYEQDTRRPPLAFAYAGVQLQNGQGHALNFWIDADRKMWALEPQTITSAKNGLMPLRDAGITKVFDVKIL